MEILLPQKQFFKDRINYMLRHFHKGPLTHKNILLRFPISDHEFINISIDDKMYEVIITYVDKKKGISRHRWFGREIKMVYEGGV